MMEKKSGLLKVLHCVFSRIFIVWIILVFLECSKLGSKSDEKLTKKTLQSSFEIIRIRPGRIFTPNGDSLNDYFEIQYSNLKDAVISGKIYDLKGAYVAEMKKGRRDDTLVWDGKDSQGRLCLSGVYIYQIEVIGAERKVINGTCVLVK